MKITGLPVWTDQKVENLIGNLLRAGVLLSALVVFCGAVVYLARHGGEPADYRVFHGEPNDLRTIPGVLRETFSFQGQGHHPVGAAFADRNPGRQSHALDFRLCG